MSEHSVNIENMEKKEITGSGVNGKNRQILLFPGMLPGRIQERQK